MTSYRKDIRKIHVRNDIGLQVDRTCAKAVSRGKGAIQKVHILQSVTNTAPKSLGQKDLVVLR